MELDAVIQRRRAELGSELFAHVYASAERQELLVVPVNQYPDTRTVIEAPMPMGRSYATLVVEKQGARLPLGSPVHQIGRQVRSALVEMTRQRVDPFAQPMGASEGFLRSAGPDARLQASYVRLTVATDGPDWLVMTVVYEHVDDAELAPT